MTSSLLKQAQAGDGKAIAALLNQSLQPRGITVRGERHSYCLQLWLRGENLLPQATVVAYVHRVVERLQVSSIGILQIQAEPTDTPQAGWRVEVSLLTAESEGVGEEAPTQMPAPWAKPASMGTDGPTQPPRASVSPQQISLPRSEAVARAYQELHLEGEASLERVESAYFRAKAACLRRGDRAALEPLKWAYQVLKDHLEAQATAADQPSVAGVAPDLNPMAAVQALLHDRGVPALVMAQGEQLQIRWPAVRVTNPKQAMAQVYTLLSRQDLATLGLEGIKTLVFLGLNRRNQVVWRQTLPMPQPVSVEEDSDLMSFNNRYSNGLIFPVLVGLGMVMNAMPIVNGLGQGIKIWFHEFGHATIAWLSGRQAIPLPIGWTSINPHRSLLVYLGVLTLFGLLFWAGRREQKRWPMALAIGLAAIQFVMTWLMPAETFDMLFAFGGIGGEIYLSTLLMVSFFFPLPHYWRWDFYRFPVVLGAAFTFWSQFWLWKQIRQGQAEIPFGSLWGNPDHGDMNLLADVHSWTPDTLINTYDSLANLSLLVLLGVYSYVLLKQHRHWVLALSQRWLARF